jgi:predicted nucleotide-binding protein
MADVDDFIVDFEDLLNDAWKLLGRLQVLGEVAHTGYDYISSSTNRSREAIETRLSVLDACLGRAARGSINHSGLVGINFKVSELRRRELMPFNQKRTVFLVHGRNPVWKNVSLLLKTCWDINAINFDDVRKSMGTGAPTTLEVLKYAFEKPLAQAVLVLLTPDEKSTLRKKLRKPGGEKAVRFTCRPNVYFELGMALSTFGQKNTIVAKVGEADIPSDIPLHVINLDDSYQARNLLKQTLDGIGVVINERGEDPTGVKFLADLENLDA